MRRLVLHIGLPKTGTTSFQRFISRNRDRLAECGLTYSDMFFGNNHGELAVPFAPNVSTMTARYGLRSHADRAAVREQLAALLDQTRRADAWIATTELLSSRLPRTKNIEEFAEFISPFFDDVMLLVAIRRADYWLPSKHVQAVKTGSRQPMDATFASRQRYLVNHQPLLERWRRVFGPEHVRVVPFLERDKRDPTALPARLLATAGVHEEIVRSWPDPADIQNESLSAHAVEVLRRLNAAGETTPLSNMKLRQRIVPLVRECWPGPSQVITPRALAELLDKGWVRTGVTDPLHADLWEEWARQPDARTMRTPRASRADMRRLSVLLDEHGIVRRRTLRHRVAARARRMSRRLPAR